MKNNLTLLMSFLLGISLLKPTAVHAQSTGLYSGFKQTNSNYISQYVPGFADAFSAYANTMKDRYNQNDATWKALVLWIANLMAASPDFDKDINAVWIGFGDRLMAYNQQHSDFENSGPWLASIKNEIQDTVDSYFPRLPLTYNDQAVKEYNNKNYGKAILHFTKALQLYPNFELVYKNRGNTYMQMKQYDLALKDYDSFFSFGNQKAVNYNSRGLVKDYLNDYPGAITDFSKAIELDGDPIYYGNRASCKVELKDYVGAISDYSKAIDLKPDDTSAYYLRGYARFHLKQYHLALVDYNKAIELAGDDKTPYRFRAELKLTLKDYKGCIEDCNVVITSNPKAPKLLLLRGQAYYKLGQKTKACQDWSSSGEQGNKEAYDFISNYCK